MDHHQSLDHFGFEGSSCSCLGQYVLDLLLLPPVGASIVNATSTIRNPWATTDHHHLVQTFVSFVAFVPSHAFKEFRFGFALREPGDSWMCHGVAGVQGSAA